MSWVIPDLRHSGIVATKMDPIVDLTAPACSGTYLALVEFGIVKIGTSTCISSRMVNIRASTFRRVALLAWTNIPERQVHSRFEADRVTYCREFFRLSGGLFTFINECRKALGFQSLEEVQLWEFGKPLPLGSPLEVDPLPSEWGTKLTSLSKSTQVSVIQILKTERFRSDRRRVLKTRIVEWISNSNLGLSEFLTPLELATLRSVTPSEPSKISPEEMSRMGRYHTHMRWHKKPKPSCEFCTPPEPPAR